MNISDFKEGDLVKLKSGGIKMIVIGVYPPGTKIPTYRKIHSDEYFISREWFIDVQWMDNSGNIRTRFINDYALIKVKDA